MLVTPGLIIEGIKAAAYSIKLY